MKWKTVQIPETLHKEVKQCCNKFGYPSVASFVSDATRRYLDKREKEANSS